MRELLDRFDTTLESPDERAVREWRRAVRDEILRRRDP